MASLAIQTGHPEIHDHERNGHPEKTQWVLNAPEPPSLWRELMDSARETVLPRGKRFPYLKDKDGLSKTVISVLQTMFPIFSWCRHYKATEFKNDLLAGLTLASLCIPQVKQAWKLTMIAKTVDISISSNRFLYLVLKSCKFHAEYWICNTSEA